MMARDPLNVVALAYDGLCTFEFGIVVELFGLPRPELARWYRLRVAQIGEGPLRAAGGILVEAPHGLCALDTAGTVLIPGWPVDGKPAPEPLLYALQQAAAGGARVLSICSGAFLLAEAGLLDGRRAATHWRYAEELARRFPAVEVDLDVLYVDEGNFITSAGSAAGIDMGLHLIRRDFGAEVANTVARRLIMPPHRDGGQKQYVETPVLPDHGPAGFAAILESLDADLAARHTLESMARAARMSKRTFARRFAEMTGTTPYRWLLSQRVSRAQRLLEMTSETVERIAESAGFSDAQTLRLHFKRVVGVSPSAYRRTFRSGDARGSGSAG